MSDNPTIDAINAATNHLSAALWSPQNDVWGRIPGQAYLSASTAVQVLRIEQMRS